MKMQHDVISINAKEHTVLAQDLKTKAMVHDHYDKLLIATGSLTAIPAISGIESPRVMLGKTCDEANQLYAVAKNSYRIAIVGGGYAGVEFAEGYRKSNHEVHLIEKDHYLLHEYLSPTMSEKVKQLLIENGVHVMTDTLVTQFNDLPNDKINLKSTNCDCDVDLVTVAPGTVPQSDLVKGQVNIAENGAIITDPYMGTSDPDIFAAGDATEVHFNPTFTTAYIPLASHAIRQGMLAGINIFNKRVRTMGTQATTGMLLFDKTIAATGLTLENAQKAHFNAASVIYEGNYRPDFMPTTAKVTVELVYDKDSRKVLGAQMMSDHEISQSANTMSVVIQNGNTIDELALLDMLFSPNFDQPFNYLNLVAQKAVDQEHGFWRK